MLKSSNKFFTFLSTICNLTKVLGGMQCLTRSCFMVAWHNQTIGQEAVLYHSPAGVLLGGHSYKYQARSGNVWCEKRGVFLGFLS